MRSDFSYNINVIRICQSMYCTVITLDSTYYSPHAFRYHPVGKRMPQICTTGETATNRLSIHYCTYPSRHSRYRIPTTVHTLSAPYSALGLRWLETYRMARLKGKNHINLVTFEHVHHVSKEVLEVQRKFPRTRQAGNTVGGSI